MSKSDKTSKVMLCDPNCSYFPDMEVPAGEWHYDEKLPCVKRRNSSKNLNVCMTDIKLIGIGSFGSIYCVTDKTGKKYALKILDNDSMNLGNYSHFTNEIEVLSKCHYPTILSLYKYYEESNIYMLFSEYIGKGSLASFFAEKEKYNQLDLNRKFVII